MRHRFTLLILQCRFGSIDPASIFRSVGNFTRSTSGSLLIGRRLPPLDHFNRCDALRSDFSTNSTTVTNEMIKLLTSLESNRPYDNLHVLVRMPYLVSISDKKEISARFVQVADRWWSRMVDTLGPDKLCNAKLTSAVHHLGRLNLEHGGIVVRKFAVNTDLNPGIKTLNHLVYLAGIVDFRKWSDRENVTSYLSGVRNLVTDPPEPGHRASIAHRYLRSTSPKFFRNLQNYLIDQEANRKKAYSQKLKPDNQDDWIFMIVHESMQILSMLRGQEIDIQTIQRGDDLLLPTLCRLCNEGFKYFCSADPSQLNNENSEITFSLLSHADNCLFWQFDPETVAPGSWRLWFQVYQKCFADKRIAILDGSAIGAVRCLAYLTYLPQVAVTFRQINYFLPLFDSWIRDVRECIDVMTKSIGDKASLENTDYISPLTDVIFDFGYIAKYLASIGEKKSIEKLQPSVPLVANAVLDLIDPRDMTSGALCRYLTGLRDFRVAAKSMGNHPEEYIQKLLDYMIRYYDHELAKIDSRRSTNPLQAHRTAMIMLLLQRLEFPVNLRLWNSLTTIFEKEFVGVSQCIGDGRVNLNLSETDWKKLRTMLVYFGDFAFYYANFNKEFKVNKSIWKRYFSAAECVLRSIKPIDQSDQTEGAADRSSRIPFFEFIYFVNVIMSMVRRFETFEEFKPILTTWEDSLEEIIDRFDSKSAYLLARKMKVVSTNSGIRFRRNLYDQLRKLGTEQAEKVKMGEKMRRRSRD